MGDFDAIDNYDDYMMMKYEIDDLNNKLCHVNNYEDDYNDSLIEINRLKSELKGKNKLISNLRDGLGKAMSHIEQIKKENELLEEEIKLHPEFEFILKNIKCHFDKLK